MEVIIKKQLKIIREHLDFYETNKVYTPPFVFGELVSQLNAIIVNCERFDERVEDNIGTDTKMDKRDILGKRIKPDQ